MNPGQDDVGDYISNDVRVMCDAGRAVAAGPAVGPGGGEVGAQAVGGEVLDRGKRIRTGPTFADLDSASDQ